MNCRITELCSKQVINVENGECLGTVSDVEIDTCCAKVLSLIVYGKPKFLGLFGRENDFIIQWCDIEVIGEDTILIKSEHRRPEHKRKMVEKLFGE